MKKCLPLFILIFFLYSCSPAKVLGKAAKEDVINSGALINAHIGISVFEPATGKWWYNYQGDKYFVPASNTKLPTCYAAMKYLGDSLVGLKYLETDTAILIQPTADPTLLHRDYKVQPVFTFLKSTKKPLIYIMPYWQSNAYGRGWNWDDYNESYAPERSSLPIYGNVAQFNLQQDGKGYKLTTDVPFYKYRINELVDPLVKNIQIKRRQFENLFDVEQATAAFTSVQIPFITYENHRLLEDTLNSHWRDRVRFPINTSFKNIYSQHSDSLLKPMMHRSDNFFAEQSLLMVSNERLGVMSDTKIIDTILKTDFKDLPQKPRWVDGSGLSRYNLFTPQDFVAILNKMRTEFGMERLKVILPTGNDGTLSNYYKSDSNYIFAKTGTLSGVVALSGFLYTQKNKLLIFSVLVNNHQASATEVRRAVEKFLVGIRTKY